MKRLLANRHPVDQNRKGVIIVFAGVMLVIVIGFAAFTVDFGMVALTKGQMQNAADSAAHAAVLEVSRAFGPGGELTQQQAETIARTSAVDMISRFRTGDVVSTNADIVRDVRVGRRTWSDSQQDWIKEWGVSPYNMVEVTVRRTKADTSALPMTFAQILGQDDFELTTTSVAALQPGEGFYLPPNSPTSDTVDILPIALDLDSWNALLDQVYGTSTSSSSGSFSDSYRWDSWTQEITEGATDGVPEINIYPDLNSSSAPGNRGTVDIGHAGNSTADLKRQIVYGINQSDMGYFPNNKLTFNANGALYLNGDTGISAGIVNAGRCRFRQLNENSAATRHISGFAI